MSHLFIASQEKFLVKLRFFEESVIARASKTLEEAIYIFCMNDLIVKSKQFL